MYACFIFFSFITSCDCMCFVGMVRRTRRSEANESDEDVPVSDYSDDSDYEEIQPSETDNDPLSRCNC